MKRPPLRQQPRHILRPLFMLELRLLPIEHHLPQPPPPPQQVTLTRLRVCLTRQFASAMWANPRHCPRASLCLLTQDCSRMRFRGMKTSILFNLRNPNGFTDDSPRVGPPDPSLLRRILRSRPGSELDNPPGSYK